MEPDDWPLGQYVLRHAPKTDPAACFLPTVSGDSDGYIVRFYVAEDP